MSIVIKYDSYINELEALYSITTTFEQVSAQKIPAIRRQFEHNRGYYDEISQLYQTIKRSLSAKKIQKQTSRTHPPTIHIALTSNHGFYGALNKEVMDSFIEYTQKSTQSDKYIVGLTGKQIAQSNNVTNYASVIFQQDNPQAQEISKLIQSVSNYKRIWVYYPKFLSVFTQIPQRQDITFAQPVAIDNTRPIKYIFEPDLEELLYFFETQVRQILFLRVLLETELSRTASRLIRMNEAAQNANEALKQTIYKKQALLRSLKNRELISSISRRIQWTQ